MKILQVVGTMNVGGAETFLMNVLRNIDKERYQFIFLCYGNAPFFYEQEINKLGAKIIKISDIKKVGYFKHIKEIIDVIKEEKVDVIHAHTLFNSCFATVAGRVCKVKKIIVHSHSTDTNTETISTFRKIYNFISKLLINLLCTNKVACGQKAGEYLYYNKFELINNGIEIEKYLYDEKVRKELRDNLGIGEENIILHVGRFCIAKNHKFLLKIFKEYLKLDNEAKLILIGGGELENEIKESIKDNNLNEHVILLGVREDTNKYYNIADYFVFPSLYEGIPLTLIEAQANGLPILASDAIDKNVKCTDNFNFMSLEHNEKEWAKVLSNLDKTRNNKDDILDNPYNIKNVLIKIEELYSK